MSTWRNPKQTHVNYPYKDPKLDWTFCTLTEFSNLVLLAELAMPGFLKEMWSQNSGLLISNYKGVRVPSSVGLARSE